MKIRILGLSICIACLLAGCTEDTTPETDPMPPSQENNNGNQDTENPDDGKQENPDDGKQENPDDGKQDAQETTDNFTNEDASKTEFSFTYTENFDMVDGAIYIHDTVERSNSIKNWVLSVDYKNVTCCGFTALVKVGKNMNFAGLQLFKTGSYDDYQFEVHADGSFVVRDPKQKVVNLPADASFIKTDDFNRIKVETVDSGKVQIYINDHLVKSFLPEELAFELTDTDHFTAMYNTQKGITKDNPAEAWIKIETLQHVK